MGNRLVRWDQGALLCYWQIANTDNNIVLLDLECGTEFEFLTSGNDKYLLETL